MAATDRKALRIIEEFLADYWRANPVKATYAGVRLYDGSLPELSVEARHEWRAARKGHLAACESALEDGHGLSRDARLELEFLRRHIKKDFAVEDAVRPVERNPCVGPETALYGLYMLTLRPFEDEQGRAEKLLERLRGVPGLLEEAARQIARPAEVPPLWVEIARQLVQGGDTFVRAVVPEMGGKCPPLAGELEAAASEAREALSRYGRFLEGMAPKAGGSFSVGEELFDSICKDYHGLDFGAEELIALGRQAVEETISALAAQARRIDHGCSWEELIDKLNSETVEPARVLPLYREHMERARDFVEERGLATIPEGERLEIVPTPSFVRVIIPYAAYIPPGPFEADQTGYFWVTPVEEGDSDSRAQRLRGHIPTKAQVTALHEAYPGHHLQFARANRLAWPMRKTFTSTVLVEGWALYCEELMYEEGFYADAKVRFMQLVGQLWRACRVVIDASLHTARMTPEEAVDMLSGVAKLSRPNAEAEVRRYTLSPTQPMSYHMGKREILKLRSSYQRHKGAGWSLKEFHDRLLEFGSLPLPVIRDAMLEELKAESS